jgi:hypothetical protein
VETWSTLLTFTAALLESFVHKPANPTKQSNKHKQDQADVGDLVNFLFTP